MPTDHIRYDLLVQDALRSVVRKVLGDAARNGLPGDHHFNISFKTQAPGVIVPAAMRQRYPDEMTIILQHEFWDLSVNGDGFEVSLNFSRKPERLTIPFDAITGFSDPSVPTSASSSSRAARRAAAEAGARPRARRAQIGASGRRRRAQASRRSRRPASQAPRPRPRRPSQDARGEPAKVVSIDAFRKK